MQMQSYRVEFATSINPAFIGKRILIAESEPMIAFDLEDILSRLGFTVVGTTRDVESSLECVRSTPLDAAVLDYWLENRTIHPVAQELMTASIPFVLTTGLEPDAPYSNAPWLQKPYSFDQINDCMTRLFAIPVVNRTPS